MNPMLSRRSFVGLASAACAAPNVFAAAPKRPFVWANMLHLGMNMWKDRDDALRLDEKAWREYVDRTRAAGFNMLVIDLGEGLVYPSHPELAVKGSWTPEKMRAELKRLRAMGLEPIPKLNFSTCHDLWLGPYERMVSSPEYYKVVSEIIADVCEIFDKPRFFHVGMDEETYCVQRNFDFIICRQGDLWFHDLDFYRREIEKHGSRAWMWGDPSWSDPTFPKKVAKSIVQSNWYYWKDVAALEPKTLLPRPANEKKPVDAVPEEGHLCQLRAFRELDEAGYDQIPCATTYYESVNLEQIADFCVKHVSPERLKGFFFCTWLPSDYAPKSKAAHDAFFPLAEKVIKKYS